MIAFGIETSCDETSCAIVRSGRFVLSNITASSLKLHKKYKGIIPEIASRAQLEYISAVAREALEKSSKGLGDIDLVCVTCGPGLAGSLLVGVAFAKTMSFCLNKPLIAVNHLEAHLYASFLSVFRSYSKSQAKQPAIPFIGLVVSGGHTSLYLVRKDFDFKLIGSTVDDAAGEAFDKVARMIGLGYPGGPLIEKMARTGDENKERFSCSGKAEFDFSFSGIKTAVLYKVHNPESRIRSADIAAGFQKAVVSVLVEKSFAACKANRIDTLVVGGGVAANCYLRRHFEEEALKREVNLFFPPSGFSLDNAAMVAGLGYQLFRSGRWLNIKFAKQI